MKKIIFLIIIFVFISSLAYAKLIKKNSRSEFNIGVGYVKKYSGDYIPPTGNRLIDESSNYIIDELGNNING